MISDEEMIRNNPELNNLSKIELEELKVSLYGFADLALGVYRLKKQGSKIPVGSFLGVAKRDIISRDGQFSTKNRGYILSSVLSGSSI